MRVRGNSMKRWQLGFWGCLGLTLAGCEEPEQIVPTTPPGAIIPRESPDKDNPAEAQGESIAVAPNSTGDSSRKPPAYTPAEPTAKGEIKTTKNGVKYETLKAGTGEELKPGMVARLYYEGKLENGKVFDSTGKTGTPKPMTIGTGQLIKGWEEGLPGMRVGETRKLIIPPAMGYGDAGAGKGQIPPNATLIFEVELMGVN
jgi:FKBP-type peptidyl-prolyl cis-trans isomerase